MTTWTDLMQGSYTLGYVDAGGVRTRYLEAGSGDNVLIFLHGVGGHLEAYTRNILPHAEHFRVIAFDMIGHGFTAKPDVAYEIPDYVRHLRDVMDALGVARAHLSGESLGGWVAEKFAAAYPQRTNRLVLNTAGGLTADPAVMQRIKTLTLAAVENATRESVRARLEWLMHDKSKVTDELVDVRFAIYSQPGFLDAMRNIMCLQDLDVRTRNLITDAELRTVEAPTLVVWTTHDPTGAVEVGQRFADTVPDGRLGVIDNAGHWPQFEQADEFNALHLDFLLGKSLHAKNRVPEASARPTH